MSVSGAIKCQGEFYLLIGQSFFFSVCGFYYMFSNIAHPFQLSCLSPYGVRSCIFFHLRLGIIPLLPTWDSQSSLCPGQLLLCLSGMCSSHLPTLTRSSHLLFLTSMCRWRCGYLAWQGSPAPSGIHRHIMPSRGQSSFPSHRNSWHPCWPSITCGDSARSSL